jgi:hypothetical protein
MSEFWQFQIVRKAIPPSNPGCVIHNPDLTVFGIDLLRTAGQCLQEEGCLLQYRERIGASFVSVRKEFSRVILDEPDSCIYGNWRKDNFCAAGFAPACCEQLNRFLKIIFTHLQINLIISKSMTKGGDLRWRTIGVM